MIDPKENLIIINIQGETQIKTREIESIELSSSLRTYVVRFVNGNRSYHIKRSNVLWLKKPVQLDPQNYYVYAHGNRCYNIVTLLRFTCGFGSYYHIEYASGSTEDYKGTDICLEKSCLAEENASNIFQYLTEVSQKNDLKDDSGNALLYRLYEKIAFIGENVCAAPYLAPEKYNIKHYGEEDIILPFGCNNSQIKAVKNAFKNQISVIQGPPGTGKTQTILNIIANIIKRGKTVLVVSNNNSATTNVLEKLAKDKMDFIVAPLGSSENKAVFTESQSKGRIYPDELSEWGIEKEDAEEYLEKLKDEIDDVQHAFSLQETLAEKRLELSDVRKEWEHYRTNFGDCDEEETTISSSQVARIMNELQDDDEPSLFAKIAKWFRLWFYRIRYKAGTDLTENRAEENIHRLRVLFYKRKIEELESYIADLESQLGSINIAKLTDSIKTKSEKYFKGSLYKKYCENHTPFSITDDGCLTMVDKVLDEFPVVLSTTFSALNSLRGVVYDYLIMDEASQVPVETGVLALSSAKNAVIVGDTKQLPNVVTQDSKNILDEVFDRYDIKEGYNCANKSFLQSVLDILPSVQQTLLKEHYRCSPDIINFCNKQFYGGDLLVMTKDDGEDKHVFAIKTVKGNHSTNHVNIREIDVIKKEVLPNIDYNKEEIGIIAPYNKQVDAINQSLGGEIEVATVHKFQGREKDVIIMSVVDDNITDFADDPSLLNVAVSRAKKKFYLVVTGNEQIHKGYITNLIDYIEYNSGTVTESLIHSVYDLLYKQYDKERMSYLQDKDRVSEYDSENITYALIEEILGSNQKYSSLDVLCHYPMNMLIRDFSPLNEEEAKYARNRLTHIDFLIYDRVSKKPALAIEVDGWSYHKEGTAQADRDKLKNSILPKYGLKLLRLSTKGSEERKVIEGALTDSL